MNFTIGSNQTYVEILNSTIVTDVQNGTIPSMDITVVDSAGVTYTATVLTGDPLLTVTPSYILDLAFFGLSTGSVPNQMYKITITATGYETEVGCVLVDEELLCQIHSMILKNVTVEGCAKTEFHILYEVLSNISTLDGCSCDDSLSLYKQLKEDVTSDQIDNTDCGCL